MAHSVPILRAKFRAALARPASGEDDDQVLGVVLVGEPLGEHRCCRHVVDRNVEETLDLAGVEVHGEDAVDADRLEGLEVTTRR